MMEAAVVVCLDGRPIHWHAPPGRSTIAIPDSGSLWDLLWEHRLNLLGVAHSHPGSGLPHPSYEDVTTFAAIEAALGRRIHWWIVNNDHVILLRWCGPGKYQYSKEEVYDTDLSCSLWIEGLRQISS